MCEITLYYYVRVALHTYTKHIYNEYALLFFFIMCVTGLCLGFIFSISFYKQYIVHNFFFSHFDNMHNSYS